MLPPLPAEGVTVQVWMLAEQLALLPLFAPLQLHVHKVALPLTVVAVPVLQRSAAGAVENVPLLDGPQAPLTAGNVNVAVTFFAELIVTVQVLPLMLSQPLQPVNTDSVPGEAVKVIWSPIEYEAVPILSIRLQIIIPELAVTVPLPVPVLVTVRTGKLLDPEKVGVLYVQ